MKEKSPFYNATYEFLSTSNPSAFNKLNDSVLRAFIVKQIQPKDNTSIFHIFERLNTGGTQLQGQEIRNCIYHGKFNDLLLRLNEDKNWRNIFGSKSINKRKRDEEIILRFFALYHNRRKYTKPMKDFLSDFMALNQNPNETRLSDFESIFLNAAKLVIDSLGVKPFNIIRGFNVASFDSVFTVIAEKLNTIDTKKLKDKYNNLKANKDFIKNITSATTDEKTVSERFRISEEFLLP